MWTRNRGKSQGTKREKKTSATIMCTDIALDSGQRRGEEKLLSSEELRHQ